MVQKRFISDSRELNITIKIKPFSIPNIQGFQLEGFRYATTLDPTMGYYQITLCRPVSRKLCVIVLSWDKFEYQ